MAKLHYPHPDPVAGPASRAACGWYDVPLTSDLERVTCKLCVRELGKLRLADDEPFEPGAERAAEYGARQLSTEDDQALKRSLQRAAERPAWSSPRQALRVLLTWREDGQGVGSTSNPHRFLKEPRGQSDPTQQVSGVVDRIHGVSVALDRAFTAPRVLTWATCSCGAGRPCRNRDGHERVEHSAELDAGMRQQVLLWSMRGRLLPGPRGASEAVPVTSDWVAQQVLEMWSVRIRAQEVDSIVQEGLRAIAHHLREIGEMAPLMGGPRKGNDAMAIDGYDLSGWDEIEKHTKMSRRVLRRLSGREKDPLPVYELPGVRGYHARAEELTAWIERNAQQRGAGAA